MNELFDLFLTFARVGGLTFGGGYAMLPMLQQEVVGKRHWATEEEIMDYYAIGQCTPGIIAVNVATFVGYKNRGVLGAIFSTAGMIFPSLIIITIIAAFLQNFAELEIVKHAFAGIRVCVGVLVLNAVQTLWKKGVVDKATMVIALVVFLGMLLLDVSPIFFVIGAGLAGWLVKKAGGAK
ncbi:MAG: chromate transporter [Ruminococcaceae bacterium]|nr:chromate transporter [Oscillospiraceae bacterium]MBQ9970151.1 chromate transporter [Oscillospiraceae bacterium]